MTLTCSNCGSPNTESHKFCSVCGARLQPTAAATQATSDGIPDPPVGGAFSVRSWDEKTGEGVVDVGTPASGLREPAASYPATSRTTPGVGPRDLPPNAGERKGDATYVPYTKSAVRDIEKKRDNRSWLIPVVVVSGLVLVGLVTLVTFLLMGQSSNTTAGIPEAENCKLPERARAEDEVVQAVCLSNEEQIKAWRDLDTEVLRGRRTGKDLEDNVNRVEMLRKHNQYGVPKNHRLDVLEVKIEGERATVRTFEEWSLTVYNKGDNSVAKQTGPDQYYEVYHMVKVSGKWMIENVDFLQPTPGVTPPAPTEP
jgi:hypothetical protein